ncbi:DUF262 domain-containing protein [Nanohaloarchaea archaeon]|nr:DUF262 domain-containing protein [Candidatus Nanohaloarchaea archaeon]
MAIYIDAPFDPERKDWNIKYYHDNEELFVKRPPYQRKTVWENSKKSELIESFVRQLYVPPVVLRQVVIDDGKTLRYEVVDGQQRITSIQEFFNNNIPLPESEELRNLHPSYDLSGKYYKELDEEIKEYIESEIDLKATLIKNIDDPESDEDRRLATEVFWRLQQGEHLTNIEKNHSKTFSPARNFIVKTADNISFDEKEYKSKDGNPERHQFFELLNRDNDRLQHLSLLARFILFELNEGPAKVTGKEVTKLFDCKREGLTLNEDLKTFENRKEIERIEEMLDLFVELFEDDPLLDENSGKVEFLNKEYFILSLYGLFRELKFGDYNFNKSNYDELREFTHEWYKRFTNEDPDDSTIFQFKEARQQNSKAVNKRHLLIENEFWRTDPDIDETDSQRTFSRAQRLKLFLESDRVCEMCIEEGKTESEAKVSWKNWDADHIVAHSQGGETKIENARVLCPSHNRGRQVKLDDPKN